MKLVNQMGKGERKWSTATLFVVSEVGIVFGAPDMVKEETIKSVGDGTEITKAGLQALINDPTNVITMEIAQKPSTKMAPLSHKASAALARQCLFETQSKILLSAFPEQP